MSAGFGFVFDVESMGLHGEGFAVGGGIFNLENGAAVREFRYFTPFEPISASEENRKWVIENIPPMQVTHWATHGVRGAFWDEWELAKVAYPGICMWAECGWPVEARFLAMCVADQTKERYWNGPYPLHEIATVMQVAGMNPMGEYPRQPPELPKHDPLADARQSARLLSEALSKIGEVERLRAWKSEAAVVLDEWESAWVAAGKPGNLGASKARSTVDEIHRLLRATAQ